MKTKNISKVTLATLAFAAFGMSFGADEYGFRVTSADDRITNDIDITGQDGNRVYGIYDNVGVNNPIDGITVRVKSTNGDALGFYEAMTKPVYTSANYYVDATNSVSGSATGIEIYNPITTGNIGSQVIDVKGQSDSWGVKGARGTMNIGTDSSIITVSSTSSNATGIQLSGMSGDIRGKINVSGNGNYTAGISSSSAANISVYADISVNSTGTNSAGINLSYYAGNVLKLNQNSVAGASYGVAGSGDIQMNSASVDAKSFAFYTSSSGAMNISGTGTNSIGGGFYAATGNISITGGDYVFTKDTFVRSSSSYAVTFAGGVQIRVESKLHMSEEFGGTLNTGADITLVARSVSDYAYISNELGSDEGRALKTDMNILGGALTVELGDGFVSFSGDVLNIAENITSGWFDSVVLVDSQGNAISEDLYEVIKDGNNYRIQLGDINVPEPATYAALFGAIVLAIAAYRRRK